jgi:hypothetical protein
MSKRARVVIELEEHFDDSVDDDTFDEYDDVDDIGDFAELVWEKRLEDIDMDSRIMNLDCYRVDH